jgi:hypothetical protein
MVCMRLPCLCRTEKKVKNMYFSRRGANRVFERQKGKMYCKYKVLYKKLVVGSRSSTPQKGQARSKQKTPVQVQVVR